MPYGEGVLGGCFRGTFTLIVQLYVMLLKNQAYPGTRAEQASLATPVRALSAALAMLLQVHPDKNPDHREEAAAALQLAFHGCATGWAR